MSLSPVAPVDLSPAALRFQQVSAINLNFGRRLRSLRTGRSVHPFDLAGELGISIRHLEDIECGREEVSLILLAEIADVFCLSISQLLNRI